MGGSSRSERLKAFRNRLREGDRIVAVMRSWVQPELALLAVGDLEITAHLGGDPQPGMGLTLEVVSLYPELVLKEVKSAASPSDAGSIEALASSFNQEHSAFEDTLRNMLPDGAEPHALYEAFSAALAKQHGLQDKFNELLSALEQLNAAAGARGIGQVHIAPWLCPHVGSAQMLRRESGKGKALPAFGQLWPQGAAGLLRFTLPSGRPVEARLHPGPPKVLFFSAAPDLKPEQLGMAVQAFFPDLHTLQGIDFKAEPGDGFAGDLLQRLHRELAPPRLHLDVRV
jgi:hypothetical protein